MTIISPERSSVPFHPLFGGVGWCGARCNAILTQLSTDTRGGSMAVKGESDYIFGLHDIGGEWLMEAAERKGWIVHTDAIAKPSDGKTFECRPIDPEHPPTYSTWTDN